MQSNECGTGARPGWGGVGSLVKTPSKPRPPVCGKGVKSTISSIGVISVPPPYLHPLVASWLPVFSRHPNRPIYFFQLRDHYFGIESIRGELFAGLAHGLAQGAVFQQFGDFVGELSAFERGDDKAGLAV